MPFVDRAEVCVNDAVVVSKIIRDLRLASPNEIIRRADRNPSRGADAPRNQRLIDKFTHPHGEIDPLLHEIYETLAHHHLHLQLWMSLVQSGHPCRYLEPSLSDWTAQPDHSRWSGTPLANL